MAPPAPPPPGITPLKSGDCYHLLAVWMSLGMTELMKELLNTVKEKTQKAGRTKEVAENDPDLMMRTLYCAAKVGIQLLYCCDIFSSFMMFC